MTERKLEAGGFAVLDGSAEPEAEGRVFTAEEKRAWDRQAQSVVRLGFQLFGAHAPELREHVEAALGSPDFEPVRGMMMNVPGLLTVLQLAGGAYAGYEVWRQRKAMEELAKNVPTIPAPVTPGQVQTLPHGNTAPAAVVQFNKGEGQGA